MQKASLLKQIEQCRKEMIMLSQSHKMTDDIVIASSKKLDALLNRYQNESRSTECSLN